MEEEVENLKVWTNPIDEFEEDGGRHPNPAQTAEMLHFINSKATEDFGVPIFLKSGPSQLITTKKKYSGVKALYKYGCGACADKARNKWWNVCMKCASAAKDPDISGLRDALNTLYDKASEIRDLDNPRLQDKAAYRERSPLKEDGKPTVESEEEFRRRNDGRNGCKRIKFCHDAT